MALPASLQGRFYAPTEEQVALGWSQDWSQYWQSHDAFRAAGGHAPTPEQTARGWTQNWDAWKTAPDEVIDGATLVCLDFTGGEAARAAKAQASKEADACQQQQLKGAPLLGPPRFPCCWRASHFESYAPSCC
jgi:hypothetical protein